MRTSTLGHALVWALAFAVTAAPAAANGGHSRGGGSGGFGATVSVTGTVYTVDPAKRNLTIKTSLGTSVKLSLGRAASITRNGAPAVLGDLALNDSITAQYRLTTLNASSLVASGPPVSTASGKPSAVSLAGGALSVGTKSLKTNAGTRISRNGQIVALRQITLKDSLVAHVAMGTNVALDLVGDGPDESEVHGVIASVVGNNVTITPNDGSPAVTIVVGPTTIIEVDDGAGTVADLLAGDAVEAEFDPTTFAAFSIEVSSEAENVEVEGTVAAVDTTAGTITITPAGGGANVVLTVNAATEFEVNDDGGALADIQAGMPIKAEYDAATLLATQIEAGGSGEGDDGGDD
jgi:hypothetical protein